ncbi:PAS/PAC sensor signal transduction histidine kinase [Chloroherpeton thalassium ATCC 35110]|uniref:histidine kinase n=1 Tax=Chloroherpeton thalassium (strain ATCC 35110 / GB-78) TaxID=517418 RepID=B3QXM0_CHLT3|nr:ATP-binding protein [Chloroherpeton thalassium]ACF14935.1 PAS/PAC sensor signal transduction histidine kinase [Chloroherpeton thalassium ATCC 35110]
MSDEATSPANEPEHISSEQKPIFLSNLPLSKPKEPVSENALQFPLKTVDLVSFFAELQKQEDIDKKLEYVCSELINFSESQSILILLFDGSLKIIRSYMNSMPDSGQGVLGKYYHEFFSKGSTLNPDFFSLLFTSSYQNSISYYISDEHLLQVTPVYLTSEHLSPQRHELKTGNSSGKTLFTPLYDNDRLIMGFIASIYAEPPDDINRHIATNEFIAEILERLISTEIDNLPRQEYTDFIQYSKLIDLSKRISELKTTKEIAETLCKEVTSLGEVRSASVVLYDANDNARDFFKYISPEFSEKEPLRPKAYSKNGIVPKFACEAIFMTESLRIEQSYCFSSSQLVELLNALESGMTPPETFSSPELGLKNFEEFPNNENFGLFIPIQTKHDLFGYVSLGTPAHELTPENFRDKLKILCFFISKIADHFWQVKLQAEKEEELQRTFSLREILSTLLETSSKIQSDEPLEHKLQTVVDATVDFFGLTYTAIVTFNEKLLITNAAYKIHPQSEFIISPQLFERRFKVNRPFSEKLLRGIISEPFQAGPCYVFKTGQLRKLLHGETPEFSTRQVTVLTGKPATVTNLSMSNLQDYLNGDKNVGIMIPLYGEQSKLIGMVSLGGVLLAGGILNTVDILDRFNVIAHFSKQIGQDYQLSLLEKERNKEIAENQRLNQTVSSLFEIASRITQTLSLNDKLALLCKAISSSGIESVIACLCNASGEIQFSQHYVSDHLISEFSQKVNSSFSPGNQIHIEPYIKLFDSPDLKLGQLSIYCADLKDIQDNENDDPLAVFDTLPNDFEEPLPPGSEDLTEGQRNLIKLLRAKGSALQGRFTLAVPIYRGTHDANDLFGILILGQFADEIDFDSAQKRFIAIDLFVKTVRADITNYLLNQTLTEESAKLRRKNLFIETLLEVNVTLSQPISIHERIKSVCEKSAANSAFSSVSAVIVDNSNYAITEFFQAVNPQSQQYGAGKNNVDSFRENGVLNREFLSLAFSEENKISNSYCFSYNQLLAKLSPEGADSSELILNGEQLLARNELIVKHQELPADSAFDIFCSNENREMQPAAVFIPMHTLNGEFFGFIALGKLLPDIEKTKDDVLEEIHLIELLVSSLAGNLENTKLTLSLARWDAKFRNLAENVEYGIMLIDPEGQIEYLNSFMKKVLNYRDKDMLGKSFFDFVHPDYVAESKTQFDHALLRDNDFNAEEPSREYELELYAASKESIPFQVTTTPQYIVSAAGNLALEGVFSILVDLRRIRALQRKQKELDTIRNNFFAMVVHDMKVPLSAIYGYSDMLKNFNPQTVDPEYFEEIMSRIHLSAGNINRLVQEILDFSKYESKMVSLNKQRHSLVLCIDLVLDQSQHDLQKKQITVRRNVGSSDFYFSFDFDKLVRVFTNLFSNAIKFSKPESTIDLIIRHEVYDNKPYALVSIKDEGEGIPEEEVELIFDAYKQAQSKHGSRGTGLGLSITKQIVELHGGEIWAESELDVGTTFHFYLPM